MRCGKEYPSLVYQKRSPVQLLNPLHWAALYIAADRRNIGLQVRRNDGHDSIPRNLDQIRHLLLHECKLPLSPLRERVDRLTVIVAVFAHPAASVARIEQQRNPRPAREPRSCPRISLSLIWATARIRLRS